MLALLGAALAADSPSIYGRQALAVAGWPTGLLSNTIVEVRTPLHRSESVLFQTTSAGLGAQVLATPAFVSVGPRLSLAPIEVFDVNFKAAHGWYFGNGLGTLPLDELTGTLDAQRDLRHDEGVTTEMWAFTVEPTLKAKVWRIVGFDAWTIDRLIFDRPAGIDSPYVYEPFRDLVISWTDTSFEHQAGLLYEALPGGDKPSLRLGPTFRHRFTLESKDDSKTLGLLVAARPGVKPAVPTLVGMALWYLADNDRVGLMPFLAAQVRWELEHPFGG